MPELTPEEQRLRKHGHLINDDIRVVLDSLDEARKQLAAMTERAERAERGRDEWQNCYAAAEKQVEELQRRNACYNDPHAIDDLAREAAEKRAVELEAKYDRLVSLVERRGFVVTEQEVRLVDDDLAAQRNKIAWLEAENDRLHEAAKPLAWSQEPPTKLPDDYVAQWPSGKRVLARIEKIEDGWWYGEDASGGRFAVPLAGSRFAGPITQPTEPSE